MQQEQYPSNSHKRRGKDDPPEKKVARVIQSEVVRRKKPLGKRFAETFFGGGDARTVWSYVTFDVLVPGAKDMMYDAFMSGLERAIFGDARAPSRRGGVRRQGEPYINYHNRYSGTGRQTESHERHRELSQRGRSRHDFDEIILEGRAEAEEVVDRLYDLVSQYEQATVSDLYDLIGISSNFTDEKWGWTELPGAGVTKVRGGYLLDLPKPEPLD